jgi:hypothetical protein
VLEIDRGREKEREGGKGKGGLRVENRKIIVAASVHVD